MKYLPAFLFFILVTRESALAQPPIRGRVIAAATGQPLAGSSVFITNTSHGTTSDKNGYFELNDVPAGKHELIISSVGYQTNVYSFSSEQLPLQLRVEMEIKVQELENVTVEPFVEEGWDKWGQTFLENFIGLSANAAHCNIRNKKAIRFRFYKKSNKVRAFCDEPIIIENRALGYQINFTLEDFEVNFREHTSIFTGYPLFEDIDKSRKGLLERWKRNRDRAFNGSIMHFMRAIYDNNLAGEGFEVRRLIRMPNTEKERVKKLYRARLAGSQGGMSVTIGSTRAADNSHHPDSTEYYERILRQDDIVEMYGKDLLNADSLVVKVDGNYKIIYFPDYLYVTYKNELEEPGYIQFYRENRRPAPQRSFVTLIDGEPVATDVNGNYFPAAKLFSGAYWGWSEKIANLLPLDYKP
jgi:hypothetical protein